MHERDVQKRIQQTLVADTHLQDEQDVQIEYVSSKLKITAREAVDTYKKLIERERPNAETAIHEIIQPWFTELTSSGIYDGLLRWSDTHAKDVQLSDSIQYYWPKDALKSYREDNHTNYKDKAMFITKFYDQDHIQQGIQTHSDSDEWWKAGFTLKKDTRNTRKGIKIWREPTVGMGFGYAIISSNYDIYVDTQHIISSLNLISPEVWIKFSQQIHSGDVWKRIEQSIKNK